MVGCTNLTVVKQFADYRPFARELKNWVRKKDGRKKIIILYTALPMFLSLAKYAKSLDRDILTCCVIADLPEFSSAIELHGIRRLYNIYQTRKTAALYGYIDRFVLLTDCMAQRLNIRAPYMVMEGIAPDDSEPAASGIAEKYSGEKYVLYTGTLNYSFGIGTLLEAFSYIPDESLKLIICGFGEAEAAISEMNDSRVIFLGRGASVLVNPRQNNEEFTRYSFPSKTMEYLASGVPVVAYRLDGIPSEYDRYINYVPDDSPQALAGVITDVLNRSAEERRLEGACAKRFVLGEKNRVRQAKRILDFLSE